VFASFHRGEVLSDAAEGVSTLPGMVEGHSARIADVVVTVLAPCPLAIAFRIYQHHDVTVLASVGGTLIEALAGAGREPCGNRHGIGNAGGIPVIDQEVAFVISL